MGLQVMGGGGGGQILKKHSRKLMRPKIANIDAITAYINCEL